MKKESRLKPLLISLIVISVGIFAYMSSVPFLEFMELKTVDLRFKSRGEILPRQDVVLAVIDEKSISQEGKWVWPRSKMADIVKKLSAAGAKIIAFDIGFLEADESHKKIIQTIKNIKNEFRDRDLRDIGFENYLKSLEIQKDNDKLLADAIKNSSAKVILGYFFHTESEMPDHIDKEHLRTHRENIRGSQYKLVRYPPGELPDVILNTASAPQSNIKVISDSTNYSGFFNMFPDRDGVVRWMPGVIKFGEDLYAPLSLMAVSAYRNTPLLVKMAEYGIEAVQIGSLTIPVDEKGQILINYRGEEKTFPHYPVTDILNGTVPDDDLRDKIVFVGVTAVGIYDMRVTPLGTVFPGVEIHANIADSILAEDFVQQPAGLAVFDFIGIIVAGLFLGIVLPRAGVISGAVIALCLFISYISLCQYFFSHKGLVFNLVYPLSVIILVYITITVYKYFTESKQKKFIKSAFSTYLAPSVVENLIKSPEKLVLGGEKRIITAFFSDVQGFTSISEKLLPEELVELLNEFLTEMTDILLNYKGTVDKFEGDAIIAFFGAPNDLDNQAEAACMACVDMQKRLTQLRAGWKKQGKPELKMRVGLYTGSAVVGNMGSKNRMDYTMMGDTVNTAARLEGVNKIYGIYTLIGETTRDAAGKRIVMREIDSINVVGKKEPVTIYQPMGYREDTDEQTIETMGHYANGLSAYRNRDWSSAILFFKAALDVTSDDGPAKTMLARCEELRKTPPAEDWNGVFTMKTK